MNAKGKKITLAVFAAVAAGLSYFFDNQLFEQALMLLAGALFGKTLPEPKDSVVGRD